MSPAEIADLASLQNLRRSITRRTARRTTTIAPESSAEWIYGEDSVHHRTECFFRIVGVRYADPRTRTTVHCQPIIDQPEIGVLSIGVSAPGAAASVLIQLKCEPGNVGAVQLAPACQATQSNLSRVHGGSTPPGAQLLRPGAKLISDSLQSEQGTRFWHKRNRNVVVTAGDESVGMGEQHLFWLSLALLRQTLAVDYLVNTDARSVLASTRWEEVMGPQPFLRDSEAMERMLGESWRSQRQDEAGDRAAAVMEWLKRLREEKIPEVSLMPLAAVPELCRTQYGLSWGTESRPFDVRHVGVSISGRERERWDQPLIDSKGFGAVTLFAYLCKGELKFVFRAVWEPGLRNRIELQPALCRAPGEIVDRDSQWLHRLAQSGTVLRQVRQSDEGGRFWRDITVYRIIIGAEPGSLPAEYIALTIREIGILTPQSVFTNEARSAISLLFSRT